MHKHDERNSFSYNKIKSMFVRNCMNLVCLVHFLRYKFHIFILTFPSRKHFHTRPYDVDRLEIKFTLILNNLYRYKHYTYLLTYIALGLMVVPHIYNMCIKVRFLKTSECSKILGFKPQYLLFNSIKNIKIIMEMNLKDCRFNLDTRIHFARKVENIGKKLPENIKVAQMKENRQLGKKRRSPNCYKTGKPVMVKITATVLGKKLSFGV